jgi:hypothetical protein
MLKYQKSLIGRGKGEMGQYRGRINHLNLINYC